MDVLSASASDSKIAWYENQGSGVFGAQQIITTQANGAWSVYAAGPGWGWGPWMCSLLLLNDDKIAWYENQGGGVFGAQQIITTQANGARSVHPADLDGDGDQDVLSASSMTTRSPGMRTMAGGISVLSSSLLRKHMELDLSMPKTWMGMGMWMYSPLLMSDDKIAWYENRWQRELRSSADHLYASIWSSICPCPRPGWGWGCGCTLRF